MKTFFFFLYHGSLVLSCSLSQYAAASPFKALKLEDARVVERQVLHGVPGRGAETFQASIALESRHRGQQVDQTKQ